MAVEEIQDRLQGLKVIFPQNAELYPDNKASVKIKAKHKKTNFIHKNTNKATSAAFLEF